MSFSPGQRIHHITLGDGVVVATEGTEFLRAWFTQGERRVPISSVTPASSRMRLVLENIQGGEARARRAWLAYQAARLPLLESAAGLTAAKIDLLPHQVVLTHRIATSQPRRYLIADEVGLGKTIETALILRELAGRGEMKRALMVVPAGLVNNWHRELNEVFHLNFEVFGSEGDVTDRKSNAFAKHDLLIASVDTLKQPRRMKRLEEAPQWDLIVFDEAHHLTAWRSGGKTKKTQNYKLAELLKEKARDLILLSATPHQGDHYRFWMLIRLLKPDVFESTEEMVEKRHRLNHVVFRRTKADACRPDGSPLFARRWVHTESFLMSVEERVFYEKLTEYLAEGFALAKRQGQKGVALGFVMTIFQKISASSFAAVQRTLRRRLIALAVHEGLIHESNHEVERRNAAWQEARELIRADYHLSDGRMDNIEVDRVMLDIKRKLLKKIQEDELALAGDEHTSEATVAASEDLAVASMDICLPEERRMIRDVLEHFPRARETKVEKLLGALRVLWAQNPQERIVIFATYLGTVEMLEKAIQTEFPDKGVTALRGGDHGAKLAAEKRFKQADGPRVLICTAAGREGINLQHARVLFNFDLPFNPMDLEQRIGRIHRYGQIDTAQIYNLVLSDTIEGSIFLLLEDKLTAIAQTLGKLDEHGQVAEDLRSQILGQLSESLKYQQLYADALADPKLERTKQELEVAIENANVARKAVFELFQDLEGFSLDEYAPLKSGSEAMLELVEFVKVATKEFKGTFDQISNTEFIVGVPGFGEPLRFVTDRDQATMHANVQLLGIDHPMVAKLIDLAGNLGPENIGISVARNGAETGLATCWKIVATDEKGRRTVRMVNLAIDMKGNRVPLLEKSFVTLFTRKPMHTSSAVEPDKMELFLNQAVQRELELNNFTKGESTWHEELVAAVHVV
jgi:superfamily II DNA or RNA helicase